MLERIKLLRNTLNLSQKDFAQQIGLTPSTYSYIEHAKCAITPRTIISICAKFNVNENWLRTGVGEMFNIIDKKYNEFFEIYNNLSLPLQEFLLTVAKELVKTQNKL